MVSERKREANRKNAQKPRGPRKLKNFHPYQDFGTFHWDLDLLAELKASYQETLQPQNQLEESLVEMLCHATLRLKRVPYLEHEYHATHPKGFLFNEKENHFGPFYRAESKLFYQQLSRYETGAQRSFYKALDTLLMLQNPPSPSRGRAGERGRPPTASRTPGSQTPRSPMLNPLDGLDSGDSPSPASVRLLASPTAAPSPSRARVMSGQQMAKSQKKTLQISHQTPPPKRPKTQPQPANSPTANRWLTQTLATVRKKIKTMTQKLQRTLLQSLTGAWGWEAFSVGHTEGPHRATLRRELMPTPRSLRGGEPGSAASPAEKASHPQATSTGPDPPDSS